MRAGFWWGDLRERDQLEVGASMLKWTFQKWDGLAWTGLIYLERRIGGGQFGHGNEPFRFLKTRGISLAADQLASQERLCPIELVHGEYYAPLYLQWYRSSVLSL